MYHCARGKGEIENKKRERSEDIYHSEKKETTSSVKNNKAREK